MMFPVGNIKYIALSMPTVGAKGASAALPRHAILGARVRA
jgi:hypothetical protein